MQPYFDTGVWVKLYVQEARSTHVVAYVKNLTESILLNAFQELEGRNALYGKRFRGELSALELQAALSALDDDFANQRWLRVPMAWTEVIPLAAQLALQHTAAIS
jgi:predicted nucleic acid-binding protein